MIMNRTGKTTGWQVILALAVAGALSALFLFGMLFSTGGEVWATQQTWSLNTKAQFDSGLLDNVATYVDYLELAKSSGFTSTATPSGTYDLRSISMTGGQDIWAVGTSGEILRWNGSGWTAVSSPTTASLYGVSMVSGQEGWAVGANKILRYWAGNWSDYGASPTNSTLYAVDMVSGTDGWAVGANNNSNIARWNGTSWSRVNSPTSSTLYSLDMVSSTDGWAVGQSGKIIRWGGSSWSNVSSPTSSTLYGVSMASPTKGWAVGAGGTIIMWNGSSWSKVASPQNPYNGSSTITFRAVRAVSDNEAWAVGYDSDTSSAIVVRWNGSQWTRLSPDPSSSTLYGLVMQNGIGMMVGANRTALKYGGYVSSGTATYTFDAGRTVTWGSNTYTASTKLGVTSVSFLFATSDDGTNWSSWAASPAGLQSRYLKQQITLATNDWMLSPRLYISNVSYSGQGASDSGPGWLPKAGPHDVKTWVYSGNVLVLFTPAPDKTYTLYKHGAEQDRDAVAVGVVTTGSNAKIASVVYGAWSDSHPLFPGRLVFTDTDVENFKEYYYYVTDGEFTGDLRDYIVAGAFPPTQTRHGNFTEHTNACTACHGLHSSPSRERGLGKLWKAPTSIDLCRSCHDGSGSKYDEVNGLVRLDVTWAVYTSALAGPFGPALGGEIVSVNPTSVHSIGAVTINQAPGSGAPSAPETWLNQLSCSSCHEPHNKYRNYRILRGSIHSGRHIRVRGFSEVAWTAPDRSDAATNQEYIGGINDFCGQCHTYFNDERLGVVDKTPSDSTVAENVYGRHRHPVGIPPAMYTAMGEKSVVVDVYGYPYPFEDADPQRQLLPNKDLPLEGTYTGADYNRNVIVCLTCHMAHGTARAGQKQVAYLNGPANNTAGAQKLDKYGGYTDRYKALYNVVNGGSTVLMRTDGVGVCQKCHQKNYVPKQYFWNGTTNLWCDQASSCGDGFVSGVGVP